MGWVRDVLWLDSFGVGYGFAGLMLGILETFEFAPYVFPGASVPVAFLLAAPPAFVLGYLYAALSAPMPRSGGDYVWVSRSLTAWLGLPSSFSFPVEDVAFVPTNIWFRGTWLISAVR